MTIALVPVTELGFNDIVRVNGRALSVRSVQKAQVTYRGATFPVVYVGGMTAEGRALYTFTPAREVIAARRG